MMAQVSTERYEVLEDLATFLRASESTIDNALRVYARNMREAAEQARKELAEAPEPAPASPGMVSIAITRGGYWHLARMFDQNATAAERAADNLEKNLDALKDV